MKLKSSQSAKDKPQIGSSALLVRDRDHRIGYLTTEQKHLLVSAYILQFLKPQFDEWVFGDRVSQDAASKASGVNFAKTLNRTPRPVAIQRLVRALQLFQKASGITFNLDLYDQIRLMTGTLFVRRSDVSILVDPRCKEFYDQCKKETGLKGFTLV